MYKTQNDKLRIIKEGLLIIGTDVAKRTHCVQPILPNGISVRKPFTIKNNRSGFESLLANLAVLKKEYDCETVIVGLEPTGHYWKALASFLFQNGIEVVLVNPHHVKRSKEFDDNTQTKSDPKDAGIIARLVKEGRFSQVYIPQGVYGELRALTNTRNQFKARLTSVLHIITAILDEYFPEYETVFKDITGKASLQILYHFPFPQDLKSLGVEGIIREFRQVVKRSVGRKRAEILHNAAYQSIGLPANKAITMKLQFYLDELKFLTQRIASIEDMMIQQLQATGISDYILSIKGVGVVSLAGFLGEIGDPSRFSSWKQIRKLAGFNLIENSSGERKGQRIISKRGRPGLRSCLYLLALVMVSKNPEFKQLYNYLITRKVNPIKKKQALVVIAIKLIKVLFTLIQKKVHYDPEKVLGTYRKDQLKAA